ncbi:hypothetical protein LZ30DRAFT_730189, partial [Colletotrichum cereale]
YNVTPACPPACKLLLCTLASMPSLFFATTATGIREQQAWSLDLSNGTLPMFSSCTSIGPIEIHISHATNPVTRLRFAVHCVLFPSSVC